MATTTKSGTDLDLIAHLLRRAGFGATRDELEEYASLGYDGALDRLFNMGDPEALPVDLIRRHQAEQSDNRIAPASGSHWMYRMATTKTPFEEKIALFWHRVFATGQTKLIQGKVMLSQIEMFRKYGLGSFRDLLIQLSRDPAMIVWLDNQDNHKDNINENYGREILELFAMGVGNYSEQDIKECSRAFTGWTIANMPYMSIRMRNNTLRPYGYVAWQYQYDPDDHDDGEKTFLGETGNFNGEDVIEIICKNPATANFVARHLYHYFQADEFPVPQWPFEEPKDPAAIQLMVDAYFANDYSIGAMLRALFESDIFKSEETRYARIKSPVELVVGTLRLAGGFDWPTQEIYKATAACNYMGQALLAPVSVEGWMGGGDWISTGSMVQRINFASGTVGDKNKKGIKAIVDGISERHPTGDVNAEDLVDDCLEFLGALQVGDDTREGLVVYAREQGEIDPRTDDGANKIVSMLQLIVSAREYQLV
ncbi:MAG: DUF1800 domain-containing protein [Chloroflexi bacterium]|jgi:uncharacterized protein (DUF1800 family)|nr:DUF1800 domain-containing protein [Chloroflexota bacterium]MBT4074195.1 DUF1800 domain-containing protein [Chloroflexota bacterium]MBT6682983.1 DUF1800 domain-containing protein [Chloroflexota bacterium]